MLHLDALARQPEFGRRTQAHWHAGSEQTPPHRRTIAGVDPDAITIRPITPDDRDALRAGFERLSPESRYRRFFVPMQELSDRDLDYLTQVDHRDHEALVAVDPRSGELVGVARFVRTSGDEAEPAIVVADDWQGQGIGTRIMDRLVARAREEGIHRFRAPVLANNEDALRLLTRLGPTERTVAGSEVELGISLEPEPEARDRLRSVLRKAADGAISPALTVLQRITWRPPRTDLDRAALRNRVVVGMDGSARARATVMSAARLAGQLHARLELVCIRSSAFDDGEGGLEPDVVAGELRDQGIEVGVHMRRQGPVASVVDVAAEQHARLIVVDAGERTGAARILASDIPYAIARHASCDVLLLRSR
jgi:RimJ/RimL family protein N-acetyltransferase/nucleotide-binding universal stress UspA family protein